MPKHKRSEGFLIDESYDPCNCIPTIIKTLSKYHVSCLGLIVVEDKEGNHLSGLHTATIPKVIGSKPVIGLVKFDFCPFCGEKLRGETDDEIHAKEN